MPDTTRRTLGELVAEAPGRAAVLDHFGLDYCCHGQRTLDEACTTAGLDAAAVAARLAQVEVAADDADYPSEPAALANFIEATHHQYLHDELPAMEALAAKVQAVHRERHAELD